MKFSISYVFTTFSIGKLPDSPAFITAFSVMKSPLLFITLKVLLPQTNASKSKEIKSKFIGVPFSVTEISQLVPASLPYKKKSKWPHPLLNTDAPPELAL